MIVVSPHFDDGIGSCAGSLDRLNRLGFASTVVTVMSLAPARSKLAVQVAAPFEAWRGEARRHEPSWQRAQEDISACQSIKVDRFELGLADAPDRRQANGRRRYTRQTFLNGPVHADDLPLVARIADRLRSLAAGTSQCLAFPIAIGRHVDHQLTAMAGLRLLNEGQPVVFYREFFYQGAPAEALAWSPSAKRLQVQLGEAELARKVTAFEHYTSQIGPLYRSQSVMLERFQSRESTEHFWVTDNPALRANAELAALGSTP